MRNYILKIINTKQFKRFWLVYLILSVFILLYFGDYLLTSGYDEVSDVIYLNDNWDVTINNKEYKDISLDDFSFKTVTKNDVVEMSTCLPDDWKYKNAVMCFHTRHSTVELFVEDKIVYKYGHERKEAGKTVGSGLLFINVLEEYKGKNIKIRLVATEKNTFSRLDNVWIGEWHNAYRFIVTDNRLPMFLGFFFVIFGVIGISIAVVAVVYSKKYWKIFWLSGFCISMGLWTLCYYNCMIVFSIPLYSISLMEYMSLFLSAATIIPYMKFYVDNMNSRKYAITYKILLSIQYIVTIVLNTLHTLDMVHAAATLYIFQIMIVVQLIFFSRVLLKSLKKEGLKNTIKITAFMGPILVIAFVGYELMEYVIRRYLGIVLPNIQGLSTLGIFIFVIILFVDLLYNITENKMEENEKALLMKKIYIDDMTSINNRRFCSEYMNNMQKEDTAFTIFSFDLNGLKEVNDVYGHIKGDILIKKAADVIREGFNDIGVVGRMGGDEFISIIKTVDQNEIKKIIDRFNELIKNANEKDKELELSISLGYASSIEIDECNNVEKIYHMADNRMYENKKLYKINRTGIR